MPAYDIVGELTIYTAATEKERLLAYFQAQLSDSGPMEINLAQVSELDCAGLQLLIMAKRKAETQNKSMQLVNHSKAVLDVLEMTRLVNFFGDPVVLTRHEESKA